MVYVEVRFNYETRQIYWKNFRKCNVFRRNRKDQRIYKRGYGVNYDTTKVGCQVLDEYNNYDPRVEISSEGYPDGEIIFIDNYLD